MHKKKKKTWSVKNLVDSGLISGWKLTELTQEKRKRERECERNVVLLPYVLFFLPKDSQIGKKRMTQRQVKVHHAGLPKPIQKNVLATSSTWKPELHSALHTLMRGDFRLFHCSARVWNGLFLSPLSHHRAPHIPSPQPPKISGSRGIKECGVGVERNGKGAVRTEWKGDNPKGKSSLGVGGEDES